MRKRKYRKRRKRDRGKPYMGKNKVDFWGRRQEKMEEKIKFISVRVGEEGHI